MIDKWLSLAELSEHLGLSKVTLYRLVAAHKIPKHRIGKLWRFRTSEIDGWVAGQGSGPKSVKKEKLTPASPPKIKVVKGGRKKPSR